VNNVPLEGYFCRTGKEKVYGDKAAARKKKQVCRVVLLKIIIFVGIMYKKDPFVH
jgi:hypothetical protein